MKDHSLKKLKFSVNPHLINKIHPDNKRFMAESSIAIEDTHENLAKAIYDGWVISDHLLIRK